VLLVEQHVADAFDIAPRACFVERGRIAKTGTGAALLQNSDVQRAYTGL
jgi:branched-chain amino acid transport system ATP-binding protein